jgi:hypothetical protein
LFDYPSFVGTVEQAFSAAGEAVRFFESSHAARSGDASVPNRSETSLQQPSLP